MSEPFKDALKKASDTLDHPACKHRCQRSLEVSEFPFPRVCPEGECQHACHDQSEHTDHTRDSADKLRSMAVRLYNLGYDAGHCDTVEGCFTDIHPSDMGTYHSDVVAEILQDLLTP